MNNLTSCLNITMEIGSILKMEFYNLIKFRKLRDEVKIGSVTIIEGSSNLCIYNNSEQIKFSTIIQPLSGFGAHWHDCKETVKVIEGTYFDKRSGKAYKKGDVINYDNYEVHQPFNPSVTQELILEVVFSV